MSGPVWSEGRRAARWVWRHYGLAVGLACLWLVTMAIQTVAGWYEFANQETEQGLTPELSDYLWVWLRTTTANHSAEILELAVIVMLVSYLFYRGCKNGAPPSAAVYDDSILARLERVRTGFKRRQP